MEFQLASTFNAIYNGNAAKLKSILDELTPAKRAEVVRSKLNGVTCLLVAARNGRTEIVRYLIDSCEADIEEVGTVEFDGETIEDAPPLWCAAAAGYLECVQLLLDKGAKVNATTKTNSTPLRAACFDGHFEIVKYLVEHGADIEIANKHGHTCLMIACYKKHAQIVSYLLSRGAEVNRQSVKGNTAMHDCAESNSLDILKHLVKSGAKCKPDLFGLTPLMTAALGGFTHIVEYLKTAYTFAYETQTDAYKLLGATFVDKHYDLSAAFNYWRRALKVSRLCGKHYFDALLKREPEYLDAYAGQNEFRTEQELEEASTDPDIMKMQSLIIRERILGINHPETVYFIRYRGGTYADSGNWGRCLSLWLYNLEKQQLFCPRPFNETTQSCYVAIIELFTIMMRKNVPSIRICDIFRVLKLAITELLTSCSVTKSGILSGGVSVNGGVAALGGPGAGADRSASTVLVSAGQGRFFQKKEKVLFHCEQSGIDRHFLIIVHLIGLVCQLKLTMTTIEWHDFMESINEFISFEPRTCHSYTLLHVLCILNNNEFKNLKVPMLDVFRLVVNAQRKTLNVIDIYGNTPLHLLFQMDRTQLRIDMVDIILRAGAHLDVFNEDGQMPLDYIKSTPARNYFKSKHVTLQCLCAQVIAKQELPYGFLSKHMQDFVELHKWKGQSKRIFYS